MPAPRPYRRTCRQFTDSQYAEGGRWGYIVHPKFAKAPEHYVRAFLLIQKDLHELFDYVEPADTNAGCFSYRIHALLLRTCVEVEANCKAILLENGYSRPGDWNMGDYKKIDKTHCLSAYQVTVPNWTGNRSVRTPFAAWSAAGTLPWYQAYNTTKHDRHSQFSQATLDHLIDAVCGLLVVLSGQFHTQDFAPGDSVLVVSGPGDGTESAIGGYFRVRFPGNMPVELQYDFDWQVLKGEIDPFQNFDYSTVA
jgi:hypothetical protein